MKTGIATVTLDTGQCPKWLFERMRRLAKGIVISIIEEFGPEELLRRLSDPVWFQSMSCVMGWDWNSSGSTPVTLASIKDGIKGLERGLGIYVCGGKGKTSKKTPEQIQSWGQFLNFPLNKTDKLIYASKMAAKVDSALVQDGFQIYHHNLIFTNSGKWAVIQQGMNTNIQRARRYHWLSDNINDFVEEPHSGVVSDIKVRPLNLTAKQSKENREISVGLVKEEPKTFLRDMRLISSKQNNLMIRPSTSSSLSLGAEGLSGTEGLIKQKRFAGFAEMELEDKEFHWHPVVREKFDLKRLQKTIFFANAKNPENFEQLLSLQGIGPKTIRALSLVSELIYGAKPSYEDPARYTFAHGGKDGTPFFVRKDIYDKILRVVEKGIKKSGASLRERNEVQKRLANFHNF